MNSLIIALFLIIIHIIFFALSSSTIISAESNCTEPLLLMWYGPFRPTGGSGEDANSPLTFLHGLWNEIHSPNRQHPDLPSIRLVAQSSFAKNTNRNKNDNEENNDNEDEDEDEVDHEEQAQMFPRLSAMSSHFFSGETQKYMIELMQNLSVPVIKRQGEREPPFPGSQQSSLSTSNDDRRCTQSQIQNKQRKFAIRLIGAINFALNSRDGTQHGAFLPPSHITEFVASWRIGQGQGQLTTPHNPEQWLPTPPDPSRVVVVCQAFSPKQWSTGPSGFPSDAPHFSGLCPPAKGIGARLRIGRIAPHIIHEVLTFSSSSSSSSSLHHLPKSWIRRINDLDQVWVTDSVYKQIIISSAKHYGFTKTNFDKKVRVVVEPIDTELWRRSDLFFLEGYEAVMMKKMNISSKNDGETSTDDNDDDDEEGNAQQQEKILEGIDPAWWRSSSIVSSHQSNSNSNSDNDENSKYSHYVRMNRNLELLNRIAMTSPQILHQQRMQSSTKHALSYLSSKNLDRRLLFDFTTGPLRQPNEEDLKKISKLPHGHFFFDASEAPDFFSQLKQDTFEVLKKSKEGAHRTSSSSVPRILTCVFSWKAVSGWDVTLRAFLEEFGSHEMYTRRHNSLGKNINNRTDDDPDNSPPILYLRTAGVTNDEFALDVPKTLDLFVQMMYSDENDGATQSDLFNMEDQEILFDQEKTKAKRKEDEWWKEFIELRNGKLTREDMVRGPKRHPVPDRPLALALALVQRKKMERELKQNPEHFKKLCFRFCPYLVSSSAVNKKNEECDSVCPKVADSPQNWRSFMRRRLFSPALSTASALGKKSSFRTPAEKQSEKELLITRPHVLVLLSSTSSSSFATHFAHERMQTLDVVKYQTLIASSDVLIATGRGGSAQVSSSIGDQTRPLQEASALGVPSMIVSTATGKNTNCDFLNETSSFVLKMDDSDRVALGEGDSSSQTKVNFEEYLVTKWARRSKSINTTATSSSLLLSWIGEPNTVAVSEMMRKLASPSEISDVELKEKGLNARRLIVDRFDAINVGKEAVRLIEELAAEEGMDF